MTLDLSLAHRAPETAARMAAAATAFLESLSPRQRGAATFPFNDDERYEWDYTPTPRNGLRLINMTREQQGAALALLDAGLSARGAAQVRQIIELEPILREAERIEMRVTRWVRDPELFWFSVFGEPGGPDPWAWRVGGHHVGVHYTIVGGELVAPTPLFFGANPATVRHGSWAGLRTLPEEEDLARALLHSLDPQQRAIAVFAETALPDIVTGRSRTADRDAVADGLAFGAMSGHQRRLLLRLIRHYVERTSHDIAANEWAQIERSGLEPITFAWAGGDQPGQGHYYAIKGPTLLIEYDNTQNGANHIHSVWRDVTNDWGEDLLAAHYAAAHRG